MGSGEKDKWRISYGESGERWVERTEAKVFANRERYKDFLIMQPSPKSLRQVIHVFRKLSGRTSYILDVQYVLYIKAEEFLLDPVVCTFG
jgi:ligand-binding SRPBCC domain-containing protein